MHYALPPRKSSTAPPFPPRSSLSSLQHRRQLKTVGIVLFVIISGLFLLSRYSHTPASGVISATIPAGTPGVVLVTLFDSEVLSQSYAQNIKNNREDYASRHGNKPNLFRDMKYNTS
jgi:mannan polymerase II complex MNN11 subunit